MIVSLSLTSGLVSLAGPAAASSGDGDLQASYSCHYEAGLGGDLKGTMKADQVSGQTDDGLIDQGACIVNDYDHGECVTTLTREGGLGVGLGDLTLDSIASEMTFRDSDIQNQNASTNCQLRELPDHVDNMNPVDIGVWVYDMAYGFEVGGALCTDSTDDDHIACEDGLDENEKKEQFCDGSDVWLHDVDLGKVEHIVVFINGPGGQVNQNCDLTENPVGGTTAPNTSWEVGINIWG